MKYGYARVSTISQDLDSDLKELKKESCQKKSILRSSLELRKGDHKSRSCMQY